MLHKMVRIAALAVVMASFGVVFSAVSAMAASPGAETVCNGITSTGGSCDGSGSDIDAVIRLAFDILSRIAGIIGIVMVIVAGIKYMTSQGDAGQVKGAKSALIYALIGLVIAALAQIIVHFVLTETDKQVAFLL